nr:hypothetical protein [Pseudomonadota bacterium]
DGRACEITGRLNGVGEQTFTIRALSATGLDDATVTFTVTPKPLGLVRQLSIFGNHACSISGDSEFYCWGNSTNGRLGFAPRITDERTIPIRVGTATNWSQISAGGEHTCAINANDEIYCWGAGANGQLGLDATSDSNTPTKVGTATNWAQVSAGSSHTCAINVLGATFKTATGELYCWGNGANGRLGIAQDATSDSNTPTKVGTATNWTQISAGGAHTCAINIFNELYCWGGGANGRLGIALSDTDDRHTPTKVGIIPNWAQVSAGSEHTCAINASGALYCWGGGFNGRLGIALSDTDDRTIPTKVGTATNWSQISVGLFHTCAINASGALYCWGAGGSGELGLNDTAGRTIPTQVGTATNWAQISNGNQYTCATNTTGQLHCWGAATNGRLGLSTININQRTPQAVTTSRTPTTAPVLTAPAVLDRVDGGGFFSNIPIAPLVYTNSGGDVSDGGCNIGTTSSSLVLPPGLRVHTVVGNGNVTCQISGTPTTFTGLLTYYITATNAIGTSEANGVSFGVNIGSPVIEDIAAEQVYTVGTQIPDLIFNNNGLSFTAINECTAASTLPQGLTVASNTNNNHCEITGTPSEVTAKTTYTIIGISSIGVADTATVTITVVAPDDGG